MAKVELKPIKLLEEYIESFKYDNNFWLNGLELAKAIKQHCYECLECYIRIYNYIELECLNIKDVDDLFSQFHEVRNWLCHKGIKEVIND